MNLEMNNAASNLLNSPSGNSVVNSVSEVVSGGLATWILIGGILLLLATAYLLYMQQINIRDFLPSYDVPPVDWRAIEKAERKEARAEARAEASAGFGENWCFVGEDVTGRWCVKVPRSDACTPERLFSSRPGCELVAASPLPLGLVDKGGAAMNPLIAAMHTK
jgi:hypothetical protein